MAEWVCGRWSFRMTCPKLTLSGVVAVEMVVAKLWLVVNSMKFNGGFLEWGYPKSLKSWMMTHQTSWPFRLPYHRVDINKQIVKEYQFVGFPVRYVYNMRMYCISMFTFIQNRVCIHRICLPPTCCKQQGKPPQEAKHNLKNPHIHIPSPTYHRMMQWDE